MDVFEANPWDTDLLADLNLEVHDLHVAGAPGVFHHATHEAARADFQRMLDWTDTQVFIGYEDTDPVGYMVVTLQVRPANAFTVERRVLYIEQLGVRAVYRRRGCGAAFIEYAQALARQRGLTRLELDTWAFNHQAQAFFAGQGFEPMRIRMGLDL